jgi:hypothetical protein
MTMPAHTAQSLLEKIQSLPSDRIEEVEDFVEFLRTRSQARTTRLGVLDFPVDDLGPWPKDLSLHREDLYGDDGR